jgi:hypothetical protein
MATAHGETVQFLTRNPDLKPTVRPILNGQVIGVALDDPAGHELSCAIRLRFDALQSAAVPESDPDELLAAVRAALTNYCYNDSGDVWIDAVTLATAVRRLDELLSSGRVGLPADWTHCEYSDE